MARSFTAGSSHLLEFGGAALTAHPISMACWFKPTDATPAAIQSLMSISKFDTSGGAHYWLLALATNASVIARNRAGGTGASGASGLTVTTDWNHGAGVWASTTSRIAYHNGVPGAANTTTRSPAGVDRTTIASGYGADNGFFDGLIAEAAIWNVALTDAEVAALAKGVSPRRIQPTALVAYWPLWGAHSPEIDCHPRSSDANDYDLTVTGATAANHAPVIPFSRRWWGGIPLIEEGGDTEDGAGSSAGAATVSGVGAALFSGAGASDGAATASGVGASLAAGAGSSSGAAAAAGVGSLLADAVAAAVGAASAQGAGASLAAAVGLASGAASVSGFSPTTTGPHFIVAGQVYAPGAARGEVHAPGAARGQTYAPGAAAGQVGQ
jgi:hypothetical protein